MPFSFLLSLVTISFLSLLSESFYHWFFFRRNFEKFFSVLSKKFLRIYPRHSNHYILEEDLFITRIFREPVQRTYSESKTNSWLYYSDAEAESDYLQYCADWKRKKRSQPKFDIFDSNFPCISNLFEDSDSADSQFGPDEVDIDYIVDRILNWRCPDCLSPHCLWDSSCVPSYHFHLHRVLLNSELATCISII